jgi:hypothetical protein
MVAGLRWRREVLIRPSPRRVGAKRVTGSIPVPRTTVFAVQTRCHHPPTPAVTWFGPDTAQGTQATTPANSQHHSTRATAATTPSGQPRQGPGQHHSTSHHPTGQQGGSKRHNPSNHPLQTGGWVGRAKRTAKHTPHPLGTSPLRFLPKIFCPAKLAGSKGFRWSGDCFAECLVQQWVRFRSVLAGYGKRRTSLPALNGGKRAGRQS